MGPSGGGGEYMDWAVSLPTEGQRETAQRLGGEVDVTTINEWYALVTSVDVEAGQDPICYGLHRLGRAVEPISGPCAVVLRDVRPGDVDAADT